MSRVIKDYPPETRSYSHNNLQCIYCGNTTAFYSNLKLKHELTVDGSGSLMVELNQKKTQRLMESISNNIWSMIDNAQMTGKEIFFCANCEDSEGVDLQTRLLDYCWQTGCPGCEICCEYISEEDFKDICTDCIKSRDGKITPEDCVYSCDYYDSGLEQVFIHYGTSLEDLLVELGYK